MKRTIIIYCLLFFFVNISAQQTFQIAIWPQGAPDSNGITVPEKTNDSGWIENISEASITIYSADKAKNTGIAVLICPGGGYGGHASVHEGSQFARWFVENGITAFVLKYRLPNAHSDIPLKDTKEAMKIIRNRASEWGVNPKKIGVIGFSAGGHLASTLLTHFDDLSHPDFGILFYPVITRDETFTHWGTRSNLIGNGYNAELVELYSNEKQIKVNTPPTLLLLSDDDKAVVPKNSVLFYLGLKEKNILSSMHIFPEGGHGWGFHSDFRYHEEMKSIVLSWINLFK